MTTASLAAAAEMPLPGNDGAGRTSSRGGSSGGNWSKGPGESSVPEMRVKVQLDKALFPTPITLPVSFW